MGTSGRSEGRVRVRRLRGRVIFVILLIRTSVVVLDGVLGMFEM